MVSFRMRKISKDDRALINVLLQEKNWSSKRLWRKFSGKNWAWTRVGRLLKKINSISSSFFPIIVRILSIGRSQFSAK